jgi:Mg2+-importing ATPase
MGDGINDAAAMKASDVGISVDNAVDIAKETADVILLEKDIMVLEEGIIEGRKTYSNMIKYIKMTASSNFGNMFAVLAACFLIPFVPMFPIQILFLNLIYDFSCMAIPWDNVDKEFLRRPRKWDSSSVGKFMLWIGPTSSVFDITTYLIMFFVLCPAALVAAGFGEFVAASGFLIPWGELMAMVEAGVPNAHNAMMLFIAIFQAGWFIESMWTQTLVIHMIRTPKIPFIQSRASWSLTTLTFIGIGVLTAIPFTSFGERLGVAGRALDGSFATLAPSFWPWLAANVIGYMVLVSIFKAIYIKRYKELL